MGGGLRLRRTDGAGRGDEGGQQADINVTDPKTGGEERQVHEVDGRRRWFEWGRSKTMHLQTKDPLSKAQKDREERYGSTRSSMGRCPDDTSVDGGVTAAQGCGSG